jgi:hypothetical protein
MASISVPSQIGNLERKAHLTGVLSPYSDPSRLGQVEERSHSIVQRIDLFRISEEQTVSDMSTHG